MPGTKNPSISSQRKKAIDAWDEDEFGNLVRKGKAKATKLPEGSKTKELRQANLLSSNRLRRVKA
jgi:hypothetical protein